jgi:hypothetical protein
MSEIERETGRLDVDGVNIYYERAGTGEHVVLLLPGVLGMCPSAQPHLYYYE